MCSGRFPTVSQIVDLYTLFNHCSLFNVHVYLQPHLNCLPATHVLTSAIVTVQQHILPNPEPVLHKPVSTMVISNCANSSTVLYRECYILCRYACCLSQVIHPMFTTLNWATLYHTVPITFKNFWPTACYPASRCLVGHQAAPSLPRREVHHFIITYFKSTWCQSENAPPASIITLPVSSIWQG